MRCGPWSRNRRRRANRRRDSRAERGAIGIFDYTSRVAIASHASLDAVNDRELLHRFTIAVPLALLVPTACAVAFLNVASLPAAHVNFAGIPWMSITFCVVATTAITLWLRRRLIRQIRALSEGRPTDFAWLRRLAIEGVVAVVAFVIGAVVLVGVESQRSGAPHGPLSLWVACGVTLILIVNVLIQAFLYLQDLFGRYFGRFAEGRTLVPVRWRLVAIGVGNTFVSGTALLVFQAAYSETVSTDVWLVWGLLMINAVTLSYLAYAGFAASVAPLDEALTQRVTDDKALQPRSVDEVGALMYQLKRLLETSAAAQRGLRESEARLRMFAESASDYFFEIDEDLRYSFFSDRFREITGVDPALIIGRSVNELRRQFNFIDADDLLVDMNEHRPFRSHRFAVARAAGGQLHVEVSGIPYFDETGRFCGYRCTGTDVTEIVEAQKALRINQAELAQSQKMEAVGQLTGGIAHDFNNLLTVILGNLELLHLHAAGQPKLMKHIESATAAAARGGALTQRLLAFSRRQSLHPASVDVAALLHGMQDLLQRTLGEDIDVDIVVQPGLWRCTVDRNQLESAILNLALNARDAMPSGGRLTMELDNRAALAGIGPDVDRSNDYVRLRITDTGRGIEPDVLPHIFEPFFTTKGPGEGSGLGLSMVYGFINQSGGSVAVTSTVGVGTTAEIVLPRAKADAREPDDVADRETRSGQGQTILVIEDDPGVTAVIGEGLRQLGYRVMHVATGAEALQRIGDIGRIDLVLSDIVLPGGLSGLDIEEAIKRQRPDVRFLFMSGYAQDELDRKGPRKGHGGSPPLDVLRKPFQLTELADRVIEALAVDA